jgi:hypothetical protein
VPHRNDQIVPGTSRRSMMIMRLEHEQMEWGSISK